MREIIAGVVYNFWEAFFVELNLRFRVLSGLGTCVVEFSGESSYQMWRSEQLLVWTQTQSQWSMSVVASDCVLVICPSGYIGDSLLS